MIEALPPRLPLPQPIVGSGKTVEVATAHSPLDTTQIQWEKAPFYDIPGISSKTADEQVDFLILAFALLVSRGTFSGEWSSFSWGFYEQLDNKTPPQMFPKEIYMKDLLDGNGNIAMVLKTLKALRRDQENACTPGSAICMTAQEIQSQKNESVSLSLIPTSAHFISLNYPP